MTEQVPLNETWLRIGVNRLLGRPPANEDRPNSATPAISTFFRPSRSARAPPNNRNPPLANWLLIFGERHLQAVLREYVEHYNRERPHLALDLRPPETTCGRQSAGSGLASLRAAMTSGSALPTAASSTRSTTPDG